MRKILILTNENDESSSEVIDWLIHFNIPFLRINDHGVFHVSNIAINSEKTDVEFSINGHILWLSEIKAFWYRRGRLNCEINFPEKHTTYLTQEFQAVVDFFLHSLEQKSRVSLYKNRDINKGIQLQTAKRNGLIIPNTLITTNKLALESFKSDAGGIISKSIQSSLMVFNDNLVEMLYTNKIDDDDIASFPDNFFLTKFQEEIEKDFELRIFYLDDEFYPMAIFSQQNTQTKVDFRNYDYEYPNRCVPFKLPVYVKEKLQGLMNDLNLLSGSIDMIVDKNGNYIFLEVNPVGQFGMVSMPCNYNLEKIIAEKLIL